MHGAGQFNVYRTLFEGNTSVMPARFEPEEVWHTVMQYGVNVMQVTGDAMARPLADTLERMQGESTSRRSSRSAAPPRSSRRR